MNQLKFEEYRQPWETGPHWELKREFMEKYFDLFPEDRLLCLAQAYSNVVLMNCSYPDPVMIQINQLAKPLKMRKRFQGTVDDETDENESTKEGRQNKKMKLLHEKCKKPFKIIKFCSSSEKVEPFPASLNPRDQSSVSSQQALDNGLSSPSIQDGVSIVSQTVDANRLTESPNVMPVNAPASRNCLNPPPITPHDDLSREIKVDPVPMSTENSAPTSQGQSLNKKAEKDCTLPQTVAGCSNLKNVKAGVGKELANALGEKEALDFFQKIKALQNKCLNPYDCIQGAANYIKVGNFLQYQINQVKKTKGDDPHKFCCTLTLKGCTIASGLSSSKKKAKLACGVNAYDTLLNLASGPNQNNVENDIISKKPSQLNLPDDDYFNLSRLRSLLANRDVKVPSITNAVSALKLDDLVTCKRVLDEIPGPNNKLVKMNCWKFFYKDILIAFGMDPKLKNARHLGVKSAFSKLKNLNLCKVERNELIDVTDVSYQSFYLCNRENNAGNASAKDAAVNDMNSYGGESFSLNRELFHSSFRDSFVLIYSAAKAKTLRCILPLSASFCQKTFEYNVLHDPEHNQFRSDVLINKIPVGTGFAQNKDDAKTAACQNAFDELKKRYYVIEIKDNYEAKSKVTREQVFASAIASEALQETNIGCKMLKNMGWTGGGLGGSGIAEPVGIDTTQNFKRGLGFGATKDTEAKTFRKKIHSMLKDFSDSNSMSDLIFAKAFSKEERKEIHQIAGRYNLHSASQGKGGNRYLVLKRKYNLQELLNYLVQTGGSDEKFRLLDATRDDKNPFKSF